MTQKFPTIKVFKKDFRNKIDEINKYYETLFRNHFRTSKGFNTGMHDDIYYCSALFTFSKLYPENTKTIFYKVIL